MKPRAVRFGSSVLAIIFGVGLMFALTRVGDRSKGPLEDLLTSVANTVDNLDNKYVTRRNSRKRVKEMGWFEDYRNNIDSLKHPKRIFLGAFDNNTDVSFQNILNIENKIEEKLALIHIYSAWGSKPEQRFPTKKLNAIADLGSVPVISWEPWLQDFNKAKHPELKDVDTRDKGGMMDVANGVYDFYLKTWVRDLKRYGKPVFIRLGHEMNDPYRYAWGPHNNLPEEFVLAWQYVVDYFKAAGVENVVWIWSPHPAYGYFKQYYPGDDYVDWIGVPVLNYGNVAIWSQWWSVDDIYGRVYEDLIVFNRPIMLTEFGSLAVGGERNDWYGDALCTLKEKYPYTKSVVFFHNTNDYTLTNKSLDWSFVNDTLVVNSIRYCVNGWSE